LPRTGGILAMRWLEYSDPSIPSTRHPPGSAILAHGAPHALDSRDVRSERLPQHIAHLTSRVPVGRGHTG
jgi:hypothetical protein